MNCEKCGKEIDEQSGVCANCGTTINPKTSKWDFTANTGVLSFVAASLAVTLGIVSILSYKSYLEYYSYYGYSTANSIGFWFITGLAFAASALGLLSGVLSLTKTRFNIAIIGPVLLVVSGVFTFAIEYLYQFGFSDGLTVPAITMIVLSLVSLALMIKSKSAFVDYRASVEAPEDTLPSEASAEQATS